MFISKDLVFLELQKTGGSHILRLLSQWVDGEVVGKHNRLDRGSDERFVLGSIRNPWDWYVSLWAYGVGGQGAIRARTHRGLDFDYYWRMLPKSMGKNWLTPLELVTAIFHDCLKPVSSWEATYQDAENPKQFRAWLKLLLSKERRFDFGEGFAFSPVSRQAGLMTYRYLRLFTLGDEIYRDGNLGHIDGIREFDKARNIAKAMIRTECLEDDFIVALEKAGYPVSAEQREAIKNSGKTNRSKRNKAAFYYDQETLDLVAERERFLIEKYGYSPPALDASA
jgi:hypothetical protein